MMKQTQRESNPFRYTDSNKRYHTFDYHMKKTYGGKCAKIPLDASFTCPNIDGTKGIGGCIYCSEGSRDRNIDANCKSIEEQYAQMRAVMSKKWDTQRCIPYLQANTNTYASVENLRELYSRIAGLPNAVAFFIGTRADCIDEEKASLIAEISDKIPVTVELGLQTVHDSTAEKINRCHTFNDFLTGYNILRKASTEKNVSICVHLINGLPNETEEMMIENAKITSSLKPDQIKIHLLHVLKGTEMEHLYNSGKYTPITIESYVSTVCSQLELFSAETVIGRLTGDGIKSELIAPEWSLKKTIILNSIDKELYRRNSYQGKYYRETI